VLRASSRSRVPTWVRLPALSRLENGNCLRNRRAAFHRTCAGRSGNGPFNNPARAEHLKIPAHGLAQATDSCGQGRQQQTEAITQLPKARSDSSVKCSRRCWRSADQQAPPTIKPSQPRHSSRGGEGFFYFLAAAKKKPRARTAPAGQDKHSND
jgi:hypothetical protein